MPRVIRFELPAAEPERAIGFYRGVFGWGFQRWDGPQPFWLIRTGCDDEPGIDGGLMRRPEGGVVNTIGVESVDDYVAKVEAHGGSVAVPKMPVLGVGWLAYCKDTEGNTFGLMQADLAAK